MIEGPIGGAAFNNEFGRPDICGYFRTFEQAAHGDPGGRVRGYHKPIMIAGGLGNVRRKHVEKGEIPVGAKIVVLGGPAMLIGLGGGAASSVQRARAPISTSPRCSAAIRKSSAAHRKSSIDAPRGGLSIPSSSSTTWAPAACRMPCPKPSRTRRAAARASTWRAIPNDEPGMSPMELWCNESQERYVLLIDTARLEDFAAIARRERCPYAVLGEIDDTGVLVLEDRQNGNRPVDLPLEVLLGKAPKMLRDVRRIAPAQAAISDRSTRSARSRVSPAAFPGRGRQDLPDLDWRSHRRRHDQPRPDGGALAGAGGRRRRDDGGLLRARRRSDVDGRTHAGGGARCARVRATRGRRGTHQHSRGRHRCVVEREAVGQLDGGLRRARRGRGAVRHGAHGGRRTVSRAGHRHTGRQGFTVDENGVGRRLTTQVRGRARVADHFRVRAGGRCAQDLDATAAHRSRCDRVAARGSGQGREPARWLGARAGVRRVGQRACGSGVAQRC